MALGMMIYCASWLLFAVSIALPVYGGWTGYQHNYRTWAMACSVYLAAIAMIRVSYASMENTAELRAALGQEAYDGISIGVHILTVYIAPAIFLCATVTFLIGLYIPKTKGSPSPTHKAPATRTEDD